MTTKTTKTHAQYYEGLGRRKEAIARVRLLDDGKNHFVVNGKVLEKYFPTEEMCLIAKSVLTDLSITSKLSVSAKLLGGGIHSQAEALAHGVARALLKFAPERKADLRKGKHLTRDARMKERRKFGLKKARKSPQWSKR
ncbi:30S ribosomal protein S9 [Candidatus Nomurabacteria bacterium]|nr:30S ribosomal protein S9 [Candidatus Nomurabacteria bacterium]